MSPGVKGTCQSGPGLLFCFNMLTDTSRKALENEDKLEGALRPRRLAEFIGQDSLKEKLEISIRSARMRARPLDHILFSGPPGLGKTTLAAIIAEEMGGKFHSTSAPALTRPGDLAKLLTLVESGDVLFIDEIHRLNRPCEEILYPAMEDGYIDFIIGEGVTAQSIKLNLQPFTLIGATTRTGMLTSPLKARFGIDLKLEFYDDENLTRIITRTAGLMDLAFSETAARAVAGRARMTPRVANRLCRRIRDYAVVGGVSRIETEFVEACLARLGVDSLGLVELDRKLLSLMIERYRGGPVGIKTLAALVDEEERTLEEDHEPFMLRKGLWEKTSQGRMVTPDGYRHLGVELADDYGRGSRTDARAEPPDLFDG